LVLCTDLFLVWYELPVFLDSFGPLIARRKKHPSAFHYVVGRWQGAPENWNFEGIRKFMLIGKS
jgi:hypothetical protein